MMESSFILCLDGLYGAGWGISTFSVAVSQKEFSLAMFFKDG